jgi:hypothetical protein
MRKMMGHPMMIVTILLSQMSNRKKQQMLTQPVPVPVVLIMQIMQIELMLIVIYQLIAIKMEIAIYRRHPVLIQIPHQDEIQKMVKMREMEVSKLLKVLLMRTTKIVIKDQRQTKKERGRVGQILLVELMETEMCRKIMRRRKMGDRGKRLRRMLGRSLRISLVPMLSLTKKKKEKRGKRAETFQ